jgi:hypothetical protein
LNVTFLFNREIGRFHFWIKAQIRCFSYWQEQPEDLGIGPKQDSEYKYE